MKKYWLIVAFLGLFSLQSFAQTCIKGDCESGYGTCIYPSGAKYIGEFSNGKLHGKGIFYYSDGNKYIGHWEKQQREGKGRMKFVSGNEYFGQFKKNKMSGQGVMTYVNGDHYEGNWDNNAQNGFGIFTYVNGNRYEGQFLNGQFSGQGTLFYADGSKYEGEWLENKRNGEGMMQYPDGETVFGKWENDEYLGDWKEMAFDGDTTYLRNCNNEYCASGVGKFRYGDGSRYIGDFKNGNPEGNGVMYYKDGDRYEGGWKYHGPNGKGVMYYKTGKVIGAIWDNGKPIRKLFTQVNNGRTVVEIDHNKDVKIWAVIIGASRYTAMPTLRYTDDDAYQVYAFLKSPEGGALPDNQIKLLIDEDATKDNIVTAMRTIFLRADENDVIMFYFSGHGLPGAFLPTDYDGINNTLDHELIVNILKASKAKHKLVLADACHSGSIASAKTPVANSLRRYYEAFEATKGGTALLMSSRGEEYSLEDGGLRSGVFSHFLIKGLKGEADKDGNQIVTIQELYDYIYVKVKSYTANTQTPTLTGTYDTRMPVAITRYVAGK